jgi:hypothetical protein
MNWIEEAFDPYQRSVADCNLMGELAPSFIERVYAAIQVDVDRINRDCIQKMWRDNAELKVVTLQNKWRGILHAVWRGGWQGLRRKLSQDPLIVDFGRITCRIRDANSLISRRRLFSPGQISCRVVQKRTHKVSSCSILPDGNKKSSPVVS